MKPIKLEFQAFQSYLEKTVIDFTSLGNSGLFLIQGDTGAGKSTIFQAIIYALYGQSTDDYLKPEDLRNINAPNNILSYVKFTFEDKGHKYEIYRSMKQKGLSKSGKKEITIKSEASITDLDTNKIENLDLEKIIKLIGLDKEQFEKVILIPQGQFRSILVDSSANRSNIFTKIFHTEKYKNLGKKLSEKNNDSQTNANNILKSAKNDFQFLENNKFSIDEKNKYNELKDSDNFEKRLSFINDYINNKKIEIENNENELKNLKIEIDKLKDDCKNLINYNDIKNKLDALINEKQKLDENFSIIKNKQSILINQKSEIEKDKITLEENKKRLKKYEELNEIILKISSINQKISNNKIEIQKLNENIQNISNKINKNENQISKIPNNLNMLIAENDNKISLLNNSLSELKSYININEDLKIQKQKFSNLQIELKKLNNIENNKISKYIEAKNNFIKNIAPILANDLKEDQPCPVCGSKHHPHLATSSGKPINQDELNKIEAEKNEASERFKVCENNINNLNIEITDKENKLCLFLSCSKEDIDSKLKVINDNLNSQQLNLTNDKKKYCDLLNQKEKLNLENNNYLKEKNNINSKINNKIDEKNSLDISLSSLKTSKDLIEKELDTKTENEIKQIINKLENKISKYEKDVLENSNLFTSLQVKKSANEALINENKNTLNSLNKYSNLDANKLNKDLEEKSVLTNSLEIIQKQCNVSYSNSCQIKTRLEEQQKEYKKYEEENLIYKNLCDVFNPANAGQDNAISLETYVQTKYLDSVLEKANMRFLKMTDNKLMLIRSTKSYDGRSKFGLDINIEELQNANNQRKVATLSGGESFLASLALALGLADEVTSSIAGLRIECMFIDEGFGTLDNGSLNQLLNILNTQVNSSGNTLVGLISHIEELGDLIPNKIVVTKDSISSHLKIETN